ncbi:3'-5' exonuclease [Halomicrobium salinisoli]|uniref:3'-5' exonuclease n=1 Tax=Halomicrobium salinisoli TaxID=2878391 RepID=UPI001CEFE499
MSSDSPRRLALDIETISPHLTSDDDPDWEDPEDFQLAAIGFAYDGPGAGGRLPRTQILTRRAPGLASELDLLRRINAELWAYQPDEIVTYAGDFFDLPMLKKRPACC